MYSIGFCSLWCSFSLSLSLHIVVFRTVVPFGTVIYVGGPLAAALVL